MFRRWIAFTLASTAVLAAGAGAQEPRSTPDDRSQEEDLAKRLIQQSTGGGEGDVMDRIMRLMSEAARRLDVRFDPGESTQAVQARIMDQLDEAIKTAAAQQRPRSSDQPAAQADKRTSDTPPDPSGSQKASPDDARSSTSTEGADQGANTADVGTARGALRERRRGWGRLPERDRDEVIQGAGERILERYKAWIDRYYRALQGEDDGA